jgi:TetR/AcrR family transcriptional regulator, transcriptional repressor for nem operon
VGAKKKKKEPTPPRSARGESKQETRDALIRAGTALFAEQGLDAPSLDAICARAGFTRGAFYVHFEGREDFIVAVMESATASFLDAILSARGAELDLAQIVGAFSEAVAGGGLPLFGEVPMHQFLAACARSEALRGRYVELIEEARARVAAAVSAGQEAGRVRRDVPAGALAGLLVSIALGVFMLEEVGAPMDLPGYAGAVLKIMRG